MNARELRIGNYVSYTPRSGGGLDKPISFACVTCIGEESQFIPLQLWLKGRDFEVSLHDFVGVEPIPLTEELLLKCGFRQALFDEFVIDNSPVTFTIGKNHNGVFCADFGYGRGALHCERLHQLQNLIFALTGEELQINPTAIAP